MSSRRRFLAWLAASPALSAEPAPLDRALNVLDLEEAARQILPPAHFGYLATGTDDDATLRANREGYQKLYLRPRRLVDVSRTDPSVEVFGQKWPTPIGLAPVGNQKAFHALGEVAVARAARAKGVLPILSTATNTGIEDFIRELGRPSWYQLYTTDRWEVTERLVHRVEAAGVPVIAVTLDTKAGRRTETFERAKLLDKRECPVCHGTKPEDFFRRKPMFSGVDAVGLKTNTQAFDVKHLERLRKLVKVKLLVKGITIAEDARLCRELGLDGIVVSNHGGRAEESGRATIDGLPECLDAVGGALPVFLDGGIRRGTDVFKTLALGAKAVFIGRPYVWGLAGYGQPGVEKAIDLLKTEFDLVMRQCGTPTVAAITRAHVGTRG